MSGANSIWKRLGIAPTEDGRAIKKAYAARLKAIDPDQDPQAFIALREARDSALSRAACDRRAPAEPEEAEPEPQEALLVRTPEPVAVTVRAAAVPEREAPAAPPPEPPRRQPPNPWQIPSVEDHMNGIEAMVYASPDRPLDARALAAAGDALLRHPDMDVLSRAEAIEEWLGETIAETIPRSDALVGPASRRFGWAAKAQDWECPWYIEAVVQRERDCRFRDEAIDGDHGPAMRRLAAPPPARTDFLMAWAVGSFLRDIRANHPTLERDFDPDTIAWWDRELEERRRRYPWAKAVALAAALLGAAWLGVRAHALSAAAVAAAAAGAFGWFALKRRLERKAGGEEQAETEPLTRAEGAALAILLLLPLAALVTPAGPLTLIAFSIASGGLALLAGRAATPQEEDPVDIAWQARVALLAPILWLHGALWIDGLPMQPLIPICVASWAAFAHGDRVRAAFVDARRDASLRGTIATLALILCVRTAWTLSQTPAGSIMPLLLAGAAITVILHQIADPPDPWRKEWTAGSVIAILAAALGGPLLTLMLVIARTARTASETDED